MRRITPVKGNKMAKKKSAQALSRPPLKKRFKNSRNNDYSKNKGFERVRVPRLPFSLKKELGVLQHEEENADSESEKLHGDEYEYEEGLPEEETKKNKRFDQVDNLQYELPLDFEDEEIDEDNAFGDEHLDQSEDDTVRKGNVKVCHAGKQRLDVDLNSDEEDGMSESQVSGDSEHESGSDEEEMVARRQGLGIQSEEEEEEREEDEKRHQKMLQDITGRTLDTSDGKKKRKKVVISEAYPESEYNLDQKASGPNESLSVEDLMAPLYGKSGFGSLRKRMQQLGKNAKPVQAPLPKVQQERLERKAAYANTKEDIQKWQPLVKRNREASTINLAKRVDLRKSNTGAIAFEFRPTTDLEKDIASLLQDAGVVEAQEKDGAELLELNKLTVEDVKERQGRLAKMRSLMFRHELKAKHIKKIKSKTYHRLLKKERAKVYLGDISNDPEAAKEYAIKQEFKRAEERMTLRHKNTSKWAKRVLKRGLQTQDEGTRAAIAEQLRLNTLLTRKIHSMNDGSTSDESSSEDDDNVEDLPHSDGKPKDQIMALAKEETLKIFEGEEEEIPKSGILSLPFMLRGMEKRKKQAQDEALAAIEEYESSLRTKNSYADGRGDVNDAPKGRLVFGELNRDQGKMGSNKDKGIDFEGMLVDKGGDSEGDSEDNRDQHLSQKYNSTNSRDQVEDRFKMAPKEPNIDFNGLHELDALLSPPLTKTAGPVLVDGPNHPTQQDACVQKTLSFDIGLGNLQMQSTEKVVVPTAKRTILSEIPNSDKWLFGECTAKTREKLPTEINVEPATKKKKGKGRENQKKSNKLSSNTEEKNVRTTNVVSIAGNAKMHGDKICDKNNKDVSEPGKPNGDIFGIHLRNSAHFASDDSEEEPDKEMPSAGMALVDGVGSQLDLIQRAFAGDDVEAEFEQAKAATLNEEVPASEVVDILPGWGQWTHVQQKKGLPSWILEQKQEEKRKREEALIKRKDAKLKFVVISEKADKKAIKYNTPSLPFPYQSRDVFERSMRMPVGPDFNPIRAFQNMTQPAVLKKAGVIIDPIEYKEEKPEDESPHSVSNHGKRKSSSHTQRQNRKKMPKKSKESTSKFKTIAKKF